MTDPQMIEQMHVALAPINRLSNVGTNLQLNPRVVMFKEVVSNYKTLAAFPDYRRRTSSSSAPQSANLTHIESYEDDVDHIDGNAVSFIANVA